MATSATAWGNPQEKVRPNHHKMQALCQEASRPQIPKIKHDLIWLWIFATWYTLTFFYFLFYDPTRSLGPGCEVSDGQGPCSSSEMEAKACGNPSRSPKIKIESYEVNMLVAFQHSSAIAARTPTLATVVILDLKELLALYEKDGAVS